MMSSDAPRARDWTSYPSQSLRNLWYIKMRQRALTCRSTWRSCPFSSFSLSCRGARSSRNACHLILSLTSGPANLRHLSAPNGKNVRFPHQCVVYFLCLALKVPSCFQHADFEVKYPLPNLTHISLSRSFAGSIPVDRPGHPNNTLFFWAFERQGMNGTLTAPARENNTEPWVIWLQGGYVAGSDSLGMFPDIPSRRPGSSSLLGLSKEVGGSRKWLAWPTALTPHPQVRTDLST